MTNVAARTFSLIDLEILWNRLIGTVNEEAATLLRTSFSPVVREAGDLAAALFDARGRMVAQSVTGTPGHINSLAFSIHHFLREYPVAALSEGDVLITNDPWQTAGHLLDITVLTPIFHRGALIAFFGSTCHSVDVGGYGIGAGGSDVYEEGLHIPITYFYERGLPNRELFKLIRANVRDPDHAIGDLEAQVSANAVGGQRLISLCEEYGLDDIEDLSDAILERSIEATRGALRTVPDGVYRAVSYADGFEHPIKIVVALTVHDGEVHVDYTGTSPMSRYGINVVLNYTHAYTTFAIKSCCFPDIPNNSGTLAPVKIFAPPGCILNATFPAPVSGRHIVGMFVPSPVLLALAKAVPERVIAEGAGAVWTMQVKGRYADGGSFVSSMFNHAGGTGARSCKDGLSATAYPTGVSAVPVEVMEATSPVLFHRRELRTDSGGPGTYRGGLGQTVEFGVRSGQEWLLNALADRIRRPAQGLFGGGPGARGRIGLSSGRRIATKQRNLVRPGDVVVLDLPGGGGYGHASERAVAAVLEDVREGFVSPWAARDLYGVDVDGINFTSNELGKEGERMGVPAGQMSS